MEVKTTAVVMGVTRFKGDVEGQSHDFTKIFVEEPFAKGNVNARGSAVIEYRAGKSDEFEKFAKHAFPLQAELVLEISASGKGGQRTTCVDVRPIHSGRPAAVVKS